MLEITNLKQLDKWVTDRRDLDHDIVAIKGPAPEGATYSDGTAITLEVNVAWKDVVTNEIIAIEYAT